MSSTLLNIFLRSSSHSSRHLLAFRSLSSTPCPQQVRQFSSTPPAHARKLKERPPPSKAKLAAKERRKALKARKNIYESEKMPLAEAVKVLRVSGVLFRSFRRTESFNSTARSGGRSDEAVRDIRAHHQDRHEARICDPERTHQPSS